LNYKLDHLVHLHFLELDLLEEYFLLLLTHLMETLDNFHHHLTHLIEQFLLPNHLYHHLLMLYLKKLKLYLMYLLDLVYLVLVLFHLLLL
tara:strand:- start:16 stop:285 length:270 start_codon:yes stop_codon:yes gene_type:complete